MEDSIMKMTTTAKEDYDKFVFETIKPYCEEVTKMKIDKKILSNAVIKDKAQHIRVINGHDICPNCNLDITNKVKGMKDCYCVRCGQHIVRSWKKSEEIKKDC
jgi:hypothetical protein